MILNINEEAAASPPSDCRGGLASHSLVPMPIVPHGHISEGMSTGRPRGDSEPSWRGRCGARLGRGAMEGPGMAAHSVPWVRALRAPSV